MTQLYPRVSKEKLCRLFGKTRHAYYDHLRHQQDTGLKDDIILQLVTNIRKTLPRLGSRKLHFMLNSKSPEFIQYATQYYLPSLETE